MAGNPREHVKDKGFWDGGDSARGTNKETSGRPGGLPGSRRPNRDGIRTDIEFPETNDVDEAKS